MAKYCVICGEFEDCEHRVGAVYKPEFAKEAKAIQEIEDEIEQDFLEHADEDFEDDGLDDVDWDD